MGRHPNADFIARIILGLGIALFALQNDMPVSVRFLGWQVDGPLAGVVLATAAAGALIVLLFGIPQILTLRWKLRTLEREAAGSPPRPAFPEPPKSPEGPPPSSSSH